MSTVVNKCGCDVAALAQQVAAAGENPVVIVPLPQEQPLFLELLLAKHGAQVAQGAALVAQQCGNAQVLVYTANPQQGQTLADAIKKEAPSLAVEVLEGEASPVLREESALYAAMQGKPIRSELLDKAYPTQGWQNRPTLILDAETAYWLAAAQQGQPQGKLIHGAAVGREEEAKLEPFPLGATLADVCAAFGLQTSKALLLGGMLGRFVDTNGLENIPVAYHRDFDSLQGFADGFCLAQVGQKITQDIEAASCGKCVLCREGSWQLKAIFADVPAGKGKKTDLDIPADIGPLIQAGAFCQYGRDMVRPAMTLVELHRPELEAHMVRKTCPAGVCTTFQNYVIDPARCEGCGDCADACPEDAIEGKPGFIHMIDETLCEKCGKCAQVCPAKAVVVAAGRMKLPKKLTRVGRFK